MSHISASEKPAPAATPLTAAITGYGMRRKSTIAWCRTSAPRRTSAGRSIAGLLEAALEPVHVAAGGERPALPVTISARSGARSASQAAAVTSSADHLGAHRVQRRRAVERQRADLAVDLEAERLELGRAGNGGRGHGHSLFAFGQRGRSLTLLRWRRSATDR